jgi:lipopolysaccharide transport system permease protein
MSAEAVAARSQPRPVVGVFASLLKHRSLVWQMIRREVVGRYRGSLLGLAWSFFNPVLMLAVYTFVFSVVFQARWGVAQTETKADFALILFVGLIVHGLFAECVNRAPTLILSNANYVKKVIFPLEILPWVSMGSALFHAAISLGVLLLFYGILHWHLHWTAIFLPLILLPLVLVTAGLSWFLAATAVYVRDVSQTTGILTMILLFLSPVFYPSSVLPEPYRSVLQLNPLTFIIEQSREVVIWGNLPNWGGLAVSLAAGIAVAMAGLWWFQQTRKGFADVL